MRKWIDEVWVNFCDWAILWLFMHSTRHRDVVEIEAFFAWRQIVGHDCFVIYDNDEGITKS